MSEVNIFPQSEIAKMFARVNEAQLDTSGVRRKFLNCPYGEDKRQALDIYLPNEGDGHFPAVLFLHGGGWSGGSRADKQSAPFMHGLARGYAVVTVGYRLVPRIKYPENLFDVKSALRWLRENADTYLIDPERVALAGASAGAHLALMAAFTQGVAVFEGAPLGSACKIRAVVDQFGPTDFLKSDAQFSESGYPRMAPPPPGEPDGSDVMFGAAKSEIPNLVRVMNPIDNVHPGVPPVLIQHGRYDPVVPYRQSEALFEKISRVADEKRAVLDLYEDFLHADPGFSEEESVGKIFAFLDAHVK
jgi:acetyl esterase/lipase